MKNKSLSIFLATVILLSFSTFARAAKNENAGSGVVTGSSGQGSVTGQSTVTSPQKQPITATPSQPAVQVQNRAKTQNQGEDSQLMIETREATNLEKTAVGVKSESPRSEMAKEKMSDVATQVETLLTNKTMKGGIGEQVKQVATEQKQAQEQVKSNLNQVENRKGLLKSLIGPDYKALKSMEDQVEANQLRIEKLMELKTQLSNQSDVAMIEATIQALTEQNTQLQETVTDESQSKSMFGWLFRYFVK